MMVYLLGDVCLTHDYSQKEGKKRRFSRTKLKIGVGIKRLISIISISVLIHNDEVNMDK